MTDLDSETEPSEQFFPDVVVPAAVLMDTSRYLGVYVMKWRVFCFLFFFFMLKESCDHIGKNKCARDAKRKSLEVRHGGQRY